MLALFDFNITAGGCLSDYLLEREILSFKEAAAFIKQLPYKRNSNKENLLSVFEDGHGTCSTKHAILQQLATENNRPDLQLILGIFKMNEKNTPELTDILQKYQLEYIPEAHTYLKFNNEILDYTFPDSFTSLENDIIEEVIIQPYQITDFKVAYHRNFLKTWLAANIDITYSLDEIWEIREHCIQKLSKK